MQPTKLCLAVFLVAGALPAQTPRSMTPQEAAAEWGYTPVSGRYASEVGVPGLRVRALLMAVQLAAEPIQLEDWGQKLLHRDHLSMIQGLARVHLASEAARLRHPPCYINEPREMHEVLRRHRAGEAVNLNQWAVQKNLRRGLALAENNILRCEALLSQMAGNGASPEESDPAHQEEGRRWLPDLREHSQGTGLEDDLEEYLGEGWLAGGHGLGFSPPSRVFDLPAWWDRFVKLRALASLTRPKVVEVMVRLRELQSQLEEYRSEGDADCFRD